MSWTSQAPVTKRPTCIGTIRGQTHFLFRSVLFYSSVELYCMFWSWLSSGTGIYKNIGKSCKEESRIHYGGHWTDPCSLTICDLVCNPLLNLSAAPHFNRVQYLADGDVGKVTCFQEMMTQVPQSLYCQCLTVTKNMWGHLGACLHLSHPGLSPALL
jgi:hypothetical protein